MHRLRTAGLAALVALSLSVAIVAAEDKKPEPDPPAAAEALKPLGFLVGTWTGEGEAPGIGKYTDEYVYTWGPNRTYLKQEYSMRAGGAVAWTDEGRMGWDAETKKIVGYNFGMDGSIGRGVQVECATPNTWVMEGTVVGSPHAKFYRVTLCKVDNDHLTVLTEMRRSEEEKYEAMSSQKYQRKPAEGGAESGAESGGGVRWGRVRRRRRNHRGTEAQRTTGSRRSEGFPGGAA
ncbi:MAG: hypothetical protein HZA54_08475, partial [Planctomycetes bacterium]|nr:hypothetical protein [Planctomycetota bacterium]